MELLVDVIFGVLVAAGIGALAQGIIGSRIPGRQFSLWSLLALTFAIAVLLAIFRLVPRFSSGAAILLFSLWILGYTLSIVLQPVGWLVRYVAQHIFPLAQRGERNNP